MDFLQIDVFAQGPFKGNPLAVFPDPGELNTEQMQAIAREMNLSETTFVTAVEDSSYDVRIFTPTDELPFAGHPTIGTAWALRHLGLLTANELVQRSTAGETQVTSEGDLMWLERQGSSERDLPDPGVIADLIGVDVSETGAEFNGSELKAAVVESGGMAQLMFPIRTTDAVKNASPLPRVPEGADYQGAYCFAPAGKDRLKARGFWPAVGVSEDPATGSAAAALGFYLAERVGSVDVEIEQGVEMGRPSNIHLRAQPGVVQVGGECRLVLKGTLQALP